MKLTAGCRKCLSNQIWRRECSKTTSVVEQNTHFVQDVWINVPGDEEDDEPIAQHVQGWPHWTIWLQDCTDVATLDYMVTLQTTTLTLNQACQSDGKLFAIFCLDFKILLN